MPTIKSVERAVRGSARKHDHNKAVRSLTRTNINKAEEAIKGSDTESKAAVMLAQSTLDKAAEKGVIHPKNAARRKSRLMKKFNKIAATVATAPVAATAKAAAPKKAAKKAAPKAKKAAAKAEKKA